MLIHCALHLKQSCTTDVLRQSVLAENLDLFFGSLCFQSSLASSFSFKPLRKNNASNIANIAKPELENRDASEASKRLKNTGFVRMLAVKLGMGRLVMCTWDSTTTHMDWL